MSFRVVLSDTRKDWAEVNSLDYESVEAIAKACAWEQPLKIIYDPSKTDMLDRLLSILSSEYSMGISEIASVSTLQPDTYLDSN